MVARVYAIYILRFAPRVTLSAFDALLFIRRRTSKMKDQARSPRFVRTTAAGLQVLADRAIHKVLVLALRGLRPAFRRGAFSPTGVAPQSPRILVVDGSPWRYP